MIKEAIGRREVGVVVDRLHNGDPLFLKHLKNRRRKLVIDVLKMRQVRLGVANKPAQLARRFERINNAAGGLERRPRDLWTGKIDG